MRITELERNTTGPPVVIALPSRRDGGTVFFVLEDDATCWFGEAADVVAASLLRSVGVRLFRKRLRQQLAERQQPLRSGSS